MNRTQLGFRCTAVCVLLAACSTSEDGQNRPAADPADAGSADGANATTPTLAEPRLPVLTPCPPGWVEQREPGGRPVCEPWPETSPVNWNCSLGNRGPLCDPWPKGNLIDWSCPREWRAVVANGTTTCEPFEGLEPTRCPAGQAHFVGEPGCALVGSACPEGAFPADLPPERTVVFVRPGQSGGTGTRDRPYGRLDEVPFSALAPRTIVALSQGRHTGAAVVTTDVTLWGACPSGTILGSADRPGDATGVIFVRGGATATVSNLSIRDSRRIGIRAIGTRTKVSVQDLIIDNVEWAGISSSEGAAVIAERVVIRNTQPFPDGTVGRAVTVARGASLIARKVLFDQNHELGAAAALPGTRLEIEDAVIGNTRPSVIDESAGDGLFVALGATATLRRALVYANHEVGIAALDPGTRVVLEDVLIRDTRPRPRTNELGFGLLVSDGAAVQAARLLVERNRNSGVVVRDARTVLRASDLVIRETLAPTVDRPGLGLWVRNGASGGIQRAVIDGNRTSGVAVEGTDSVLTLQDAIVQDTLRDTSFRSGSGLRVLAGGRATVRRTLLDRNHFSGVFASGPSTRVGLSDVVIRGTSSEGMAPQDLGAGLFVQTTATATVQRLLVENNQGWGIAVVDRATFDAEDIVLQDNKSRNTDGRGGEGLVVNTAVARVKRAIMSRNLRRGIEAQAGGRVIIEQARVSGTRPGPSTAGGDGIGAFPGARVEARQLFAVDNVATAVFAQGPSCALVLEDAVLRGTRVPMPAGGKADGLAIQLGATATISRVLVDGNEFNGVFVSGEGTEAVLSDVMVVNSQSDPSRGFGRGMSIQDRSRATLRRVLVSQNLDVGLFANDRAEISFTDLTVEQTGSEAVDATGGRGLNLQNAVRFVGERLRVTQNRAIGVFVTSEGTELIVDGLHVEDTASQEADGTDGIGVSVEAGAVGMIRGATIRGNRGYGALAIAGNLTLQNVQITGTTRPTCASAQLACLHGSAGVASFMNARIDLRDSAVVDSVVCGILVGQSSEMDVARTLVQGNGIGACVQDSGFDRGRITGPTVRFEGNIDDLELTDFPPPTAGDPEGAR